MVDNEFDIDMEFDLLAENRLRQATEDHYSIMDLD